MLGKFIPVLLLISTVIHASEDDYNRAWCAKMNGVPNIPEAEYRDKYKGFYEVRKGYFRIDCIVDNKYAVEMDYGTKWFECYTQARAYGRAMGMIPGCVLILSPTETRFKDRLEKHAFEEDRFLMIWTVAK